MRPESFSEKLYIPRNIEGEPNKESLGITRIIEERLQTNESFVGLAPFGSWVSGYSHDRSDIDLYVLYDSSLPGNSELAPLLQEVEKELEEKKGRRIHLISFDINPDLIIGDITKGYFSGDHPYSSSLQAMTRVVTGETIARYRREIAEKLDKLSSQERQAAAYEIFRSLSVSDAESFGKRSKRMKDFSEEELLGILEKRRQAWARRIEQFYGVKLDANIVSKFDPKYTIMMRPDYLDEDEDEAA